MGFYISSIKSFTMSYIYGYDGAGVYETVTWRDGHDREKKNSIILTEQDAASQ